MQIRKRDIVNFLILTSPLYPLFLNKIFHGVLFNFLRFLLAATVPGYYASYYFHKKHNLSLDEFLVVDVITSSLIMMFSYIFLTVFSSNITYHHVWISVFTVSALSYLILKIFDKTPASAIKIDLLPLIAMLYSILPAIYLVGKLTPREFWRGQDIWGTYAYIRGLLKTSSSPNQYFQYISSHVRVHNFGFYYMTASYTLLTGFSIESILRYGGLFQSILLSLTIYITVKRYYGTTSALIGSSSTFIHPLIGQRFVSILRENFSIIYLVFTFYFLKLRNSEKREIELVNILTYILLITSSIIIHPLTPIFLIPILVMESLRNTIQKNYHNAIEIYLSIIFSFFILVIFVPLPLEYYYEVINWFASEFNILVFKKLGENLPTLLTAIQLLYGGALFYIYKSKIKIAKNKINKLYIVFLAVSIGVFTHVLIINPYSDGYFDVFEFNMFSPAILFASLLGYLIYSKKLPFPIIILSAMLTTLSLISYTGLFIPLKRFGVYAILIFTFSTSHLFYNVFPVSDIDLDLKKSNLNDLTRKTKAWFIQNKYPLLVLFLVASYGFHETSSFRRYAPLFSSSDIEYGYEFKNQLNNNSKVYSRDHIQELVWYIDIPHSNLVTNIDHQRNITRLLNQSSPYPLSDYLTHNYNISNFYYCVSDLNEQLYELTYEPLFEYYAERNVYGPMVVYTFRTPITPINLPVNKIKFIEDTTQQHNLEDIQTISNVVNQDNQYYALAKNRTNPRLTLYTSTDGLTWHKVAILRNSHEIQSPYLVSINNELTIYGQDPTSHQITHYTIQNHSLTQQTQPPTKNAEHVYQEYPVIWRSNNTWHMIYWETRAGEDYNTGLVYHTSQNGTQWNLIDPNLDWVLTDDTGRRYSWNKIQLTDVTPLNEGIIFHARYLAQDQHHDTYWRTGTIYHENEITQNNAIITSYVFKSNLDDTRSIRDLRFLETTSGERIIYYTVQDNNNSLHVGEPSDHHGVPQKHVVKP